MSFFPHIFSLHIFSFPEISFPSSGICSIFPPASPADFQHRCQLPVPAFPFSIFRRRPSSPISDRTLPPFSDKIFSENERGKGYTADLSTVCWVGDPRCSKAVLGLLGQREELGRGRRSFGVDGLLVRISGRRAGLLVSREGLQEGASGVSVGKWVGFPVGGGERGRARWEMGEILKMKHENGDIRVLNLLIAFSFV
jgi:hypothetical protein